MAVVLRKASLSLVARRQSRLFASTSGGDRSSFFRKRFENSLRKFKVKPYLLARDNADTKYKEMIDSEFSKIGSSQYQRRFPLISMNVKESASILIEEANKQGNKRSKRYCGIYRGMGGGKTKMALELWNHLIKEEKNVLPIVITMNGLTDVVSTGEFSPDVEGTAEMKYTHAVMARMAESVFETTSGRFTKDRFELDVSKFLAIFKQNQITPQSVSDCILALKCFVDYLFERIKKDRDPQLSSEIKTLILLLDENGKADSAEKDSAHILREALLTREYEDERRTGLFVTTLKPVPELVTNSGRYLEAFEMPTKLDAADVVKELFLTDRRGEASQKLNVPIDEVANKKALELLAEYYGGVPRLLEFAAEKIWDLAKKDDQQNPTFKIEGGVMADILKHVQNSTVAAYHGALPRNIIPRDTLFQLLFEGGGWLPLNKDYVQTMIKLSIISNPNLLRRVETSRHFNSHCLCSIRCTSTIWMTRTKMSTLL